MADQNRNGIADDLEPILAAMAAAGFQYGGLPTANTPTDKTSSTSRQYRQFTQQQVQGMAETQFQESIGRAATAEEVANVQQQLNAAEKASPTISTSGATSVTSGGVDEQQLVKQIAEMSPEYANYQQATTYFDAMLGALRGPAGGGI